MDISMFEPGGPDARRGGSTGCHECAAPLADDQRYCLHCGARRGAPRVDALAELGLVGLAPFGIASAAAGIDADARPARRVSRPLAVSLATLALTVGGALGATIHGPPSSLAASAQPAPVVLVNAGTTATAQAPATASADDGEAADGGSDDAADTNVDSGSAGDGSSGALVATSPASTPVSTPNGGNSGSPTPAGAPTPSTASPTPAPAAATEPTLPSVGHVWVVSLTGQDAGVFADVANAPYLAGTLVPQGTLLTGYRAVGDGQLANGVALLSGQAPNSATEANCPVASDVTPGVLDPKTGLVSGVGCFYAAGVPTLPGELAQTGKRWKAYLGALPNPCGTPVAASTDPAAAPAATAAAPGFVAARNAFAAFHGLADPSGAGCVPGETDLSSLAADLADPPALSWIVPSSCDSGAPEPCAQGASAGVPALDAFLARTIPAIQASTAYQRDGLIVITFDVGPPPAPDAAGSEPKPVGALLIGPRVRTATTVTTPSDHYALLRTLQKLFSLTPTGHAADAETFGDDIWTPAVSTTTTTTTRP